MVRVTFLLVSSILNFLIIFQVSPVCRSLYHYLGTSISNEMNQRIAEVKTIFWIYSRLIDSSKMFLLPTGESGDH